MKDIIHIIGHKNPDTDSIVASIAYAELKRKMGMNAIACRIGDLNPETDFVLKMCIRDRFIIFAKLIRMLIG